MGKSYIASSVVERIEPGRTEAGDASVIRCTRSRDVARLLRLQQENTEERGILTIEDAHVLAVDDLHYLVELVGNTDRAVLITMDINPVGTATDESVARARIITSLWADLGLERVDLSGIGFTEASAMIDSIVGNEGLDVVTRARIVHGASGNPMLVDELTREALRHTGSIDVSNASLILGPNTLAPRILDLARERVADLSDVDEYALVTLAKIGTVPYVRAARLVGQAPLRSLLRRGLVSHEPGALEFVSANVLYAHAAQALREVENPLEAEHTVERILLSELRMGQSIGSIECVIVSTYWMNTPQADPLEGIGADVAAGVLARAARRADVWGLPSSSEMFARRSMALSPSIPALHSLSRSLAGQGLHAAALELLEQDTTPHTSQRDDVDLLWWWYLLVATLGYSPTQHALLWKRVREWGSAEHVLTDLDYLIEQRGRMVASDFDEGTAEMTAFARDESKSLASRLRAYTQVVPAYAALGDEATVSAMLTEGRALVGEVAAQRPGRTYSDDHTAAAMFIGQGGFTISALGETRVQLRRDLDVYALRAVLQGNDLELALVNAVSGSMSISSHRAARAEVELARAEVGVARKVEPEAVVIIRLLRASALFALNRRDETAEILAGLTPDELMVSPWCDFYAQYLRILLAIDPTDMRTTHSRLIELARFRGGRTRQLSMTALYLASRAGVPATELVAVIDTLEPRGRSAVGDVFEEHLRAEAANDAFRLDAVGSKLEEFGLGEEAGRAFGLAMAAHAAHGRSTEAAVSRARRDAQTPQSLVPVAPTVPANTAALDNVARLTRRELEIARLAGIGLSNSEIASRLFLSVRTVESHVLQARVKLGASRRSELGLYLAEIESKVS
jgi:DNA-binding NarL/FixJ family response regulator